MGRHAHPNTPSGTHPRPLLPLILALALVLLASSTLTSAKADKLEDLANVRRNSRNNEILKKQVLLRERRVRKNQDEVELEAAVSAENEVKVAAAGKREAAAEAVAESKKEKVVKKRQPEDLRIGESIRSPVSPDLFPLISVVYSSWLLLT